MNDRMRPAERVKATAERLTKSPVVEETDPYTINQAGHGERTTGVQRILDGPLDRLYRAGVVTKRQFQAGHKFRQDAYLAESDGVISGSGFDATGQAPAEGRLPRPMVSDSEAVVMARSDMSQIRKRIGGRGITILDQALLKERSLEEVGRDVFGYTGPRDRAVAGKAGFLLMLGVLADFYELLSDVRRR